MISLSSVKKIVDEKNKKNFNELGGIKMYSYKTSNSDSNFDEAKQNVLNKLQEIEDKYTILEFVPEETTSLGLEKQEFTAPTEDEIRLEAEKSLSAQKENEREEIENTYEGKFNNLNNEVEDVALERDEDVEEAASNFRSSLRDATNSSIKQGISRSSIYDEAVKAIEGERNSLISAAEEEFNREMSRLEKEIDLLQRQKDNALEAFDISYAIKLEDKIADINKDIANKQKEVEKYNENVDKLEAENLKAQEQANAQRQQEIEKHNEELLKQIEKLGEAGVTQQKLRERYQVVLDFLMSIPKDVALSELTKDNYYETLLSNYYPSVYAQILRRDD